MKATAELRPPAPVPPPPSRDAPPVALAPSRPSRPSHRRALAWGIGISVVLHLLLFVYASRTHVLERPFGSAVAPAARRAAGEALPEMQALRLEVRPRTAPVEVAPAPRQEERAPTVQRRVPSGAIAPGTGVPGAGAPGAAPGERAEPGAASVVERLRPQMNDPRFWTRPGAPPEPVKSDIERARENLYSRIEAYNDSLAAEGAAAQRATDWTVTDKDGKKWGVSPGKVHLGDVTIPLPLGGSASPPNAKDARDRDRRDAEIKGQADRARVRDSFNDRTKAIRERKDQERKDKQGTSTASGSGGT